MWDFLQNLFTALLPIVTAFAGWAGARIRNTNQKDKAVERGVKMLLRAKIIDLGLHYLEAGEIPPYGMETLKGCYKEYEALGDGDHSVGDIVRRCETLKEPLNKSPSFSAERENRRLPLGSSDSVGK